ncbi:hypothetical protein G5I_10897 [Acromyrmex echinatior]|uniref:Uncharacterized protein n=1 Tax=Acromyrmex echinatior TaxID=103372 RepID=F4WY50_ACREC|nr:hypothetical protein G5I_10897 [Acromyrmex echinatior]
MDWPGRPAFYKTDAWRREREDSSRGSPLVQVSARDLMMELAEISPEKSEPKSKTKASTTGAPRASSPQTKIRESLLSSRRKFYDPVEFLAPRHRIRG